MEKCIYEKRTAESNEKHDEVTVHQEQLKSLQHSQKLNTILACDDLARLKEEIYECQMNFEDYRAHLVQKHDEAEFDAVFYQNLCTGEAIVIWDYKMKILPAYHLEAQRMFFSKRGFSLLGALVLIPLESSKNDKEFEVQYHFFFSDDSTQDAHAWNCAKEVI